MMITVNYTVISYSGRWKPSFVNFGSSPYTTLSRRSSCLRFTSPCGSSKNFRNTRTPFCDVPTPTTESCSIVTWKSLSMGLLYAVSSHCCWSTDWVLPTIIDDDDWNMSHSWSACFENNKTTAKYRSSYAYISKVACGYISFFRCSVTKVKKYRRNRMTIFKALWKWKQALQLLTVSRFSIGLFVIVSQPKRCHFFLRSIVL